MITLTSHTHTHTHTHTHHTHTHTHTQQHTHTHTPHTQSLCFLSLYAVVDKPALCLILLGTTCGGMCFPGTGGTLIQRSPCHCPWHRLTRPNAETRRHGRNLVCEITQTWPVNSNNEQRAHTNAHSCHTGLCVNAQWKTNQPSDINSLMWNTQTHKLMCSIWLLDHLHRSSIDQPLTRMTNTVFG